MATSPATAKTSAAKKTATKKAPAKTAPAKKAPAKKAPAKKTAAKKAVAKTAPAKRSTSAPNMSAAAVAREATSQLLELAGHQAEGVTALEKTDDGWRVQVQVVELRRIPETTDVLALYDVEMDAGGDLLGYRRVRRYTRGESGEE